MYFAHELRLIDYMLRKQHKVDDSHNDMPLIYYIEGHSLHFGHLEFALITGLIVTNLDVIGVIKDEEIFGLKKDRKFGFYSHLKDVIVGGLTTLKLYQEHLAGPKSQYLKDLIVTFLQRTQGQLLISNLLELSMNLRSGYIAMLFFNNRESYSVCTSDSSLKNRCLTDRIISELNVYVFKLVTIILVLALERNDKLGWLQFNEDLSILGSDFLESLNIIFQDLIDSHDSDEDIANEKSFKLEEAKRMRLEEEKKLQIAEVNKRKRLDFMNSTHVKNILGKFTPTKRNDVHSMTGKTKLKESWVKIKKYRQNLNVPSLAELLKKLNHGLSYDYTVYRDFWLRLVYLDPGHKGWLSEELLLQNSMPLFYENGDKYATPWSDVDQVFIPINETGQHWCLAYLDILSGLVTFYDRGDTYDYKLCDWREHMLEMQSFLHVSIVLAESYNFLKELQDYELEKCKELIKLISETQLKVLKKISFIAKLRCQ
ncbi:phospholipase-like protein [Tanacetum coccineum]